MGETLYRRPEILFRWGRLCFVTESPGEISYQSRGDSVSGRLYSVTPAGLMPFCLEFTSRIITDRLIRYVHREGHNQSINQSINRLIKKIPADTAATRITIANQRLFQLHTE